MEIEQNEGNEDNEDNEDTLKGLMEENFLQLIKEKFTELTTTTTIPLPENERK